MDLPPVTQPITLTVNGDGTFQWGDTTLDEAQVDAIAQSRGLENFSDVYTSADAGDTIVIRALTDFDGPQPLPGDQGGLAGQGFSDEAIQELVAGFEALFGEGGGAVMFLFLAMTVEMGITDMLTANDVKTAMGLLKAAMASGRIDALEEQLDALKDDAVRALVTAIIVAIVVVALSFAGGYVSAGSGEYASAIGSGLSGLAQPLGEVITKLSEWLSVEGGPKEREMLAKIREEVFRMLETILEMAEEGAQENWEGFKKQVENFLNALMEFIQRHGPSELNEASA